MCQDCRKMIIAICLGALPETRHQAKNDQQLLLHFETYNMEPTQKAISSHTTYNLKLVLKRPKQ
jgi:hypothetical protein